MTLRRQLSGLGDDNDGEEESDNGGGDGLDMIGGGHEQDGGDGGGDRAEGVFDVRVRAGLRSGDFRFRMVTIVSDHSLQVEKWTVC